MSSSIGGDKVFRRPRSGFPLDYPAWTVGLTFSYPLGKSAAEANLARARIEKDQAAARLRSLETSAVREVRQAAWRLEQDQQRIQAQRDLAIAGNSELQAFLDYQLAVVAFETAQRVGR